MLILIVDDHPLFRDGLKALLLGLNPTSEVLACASIEEVIQLNRIEDVDLVLLDLGLPGHTALEALKKLKEIFEAKPVVIISGEENPEIILNALNLGAAGYIPKSTDVAVTIHALRIVMARGVYLPPAILNFSAHQTGGSARLSARRSDRRLSETKFTTRQLSIIAALLKGKSNKVIAKEIGVAEGTVKAHLWAIFQSLGVNSRAQAICRCHELGLAQVIISALEETLG